MADYVRILDLLFQKKAYFCELEAVTAEMYLYQVDKLVACVDKRGKLLQQISNLDEEIDMLTAGDAAARRALQQECAKTELTPELAALYDASLSVKAIANRLLKNDDAVRMHLEYEKQRISEKIEDLNRSGAVVAESYHRSLQTGRNRPVRAAKYKLV